MFAVALVQGPTRDHCMLSKSPEVKEPVVRLRIARGPTLDQKVAASMIYI